MIQHHSTLQKYLYSILLSSNLLGEGAGESQLSPDSLDLDAIWETVVWEEIEEITTVVGEVEQVITVAGVRGADCAGRLCAAGVAHPRFDFSDSGHRASRPYRRRTGAGD